MPNRKSKQMSDEEVHDIFNKLGILSETDREKFTFPQFDKEYLKVDDQKTKFYFLMNPEILEEKETQGA